MRQSAQALFTVALAGAALALGAVGASASEGSERARQQLKPGGYFALTYDRDGCRPSVKPFLYQIAVADLAAAKRGLVAAFTAAGATDLTRGCEVTARWDPGIEDASQTYGQGLWVPSAARASLRRDLFALGSPQVADEFGLQARDGSLRPLQGIDPGELEEFERLQRELSGNPATFSDSIKRRVAEDRLKELAPRAGVIRRTKGYELTYVLLVQSAGARFSAPALGRRVVKPTVTRRPPPAGAIESAPLESENTSYWTRTYNIPDYYRRVTVTIPSSNVDSTQRQWEAKLRALGARQLEFHQQRLLKGSFVDWPGKGQTLWALLPPAVEALRLTLQRETKLAIHDQDITPPYRDELLAKRQALLDESSAHPELIESDVIRGLLEMELGVLNDNISLDDMGRKESALLLTIAPDGQLPPFVDIPPGRLGIPPIFLFQGHQSSFALSTSTSRFPENYWARAPVFDPPFLEGMLELKVPDVARSTAAIAAAANRAGFKTSDYRVVLSPAAGKPASSVASTVLVFDGDESSLLRARDLIGQCGTMMRWNIHAEGKRTHAAAADKSQLLEDEVSRLSSVLAGTPSTRTLLMAEVSRLKPYAVQYREKTGRARIEVMVSRN